MNTTLSIAGVEDDKSFSQPVNIVISSVELTW